MRLTTLNKDQLNTACLNAQTWKTGESHVADGLHLEAIKSVYRRLVDFIYWIIKDTYENMKVPADEKDT